MQWIDGLRKVHRLRWRLQKPVLSLLLGPYRSAFRGEGIEFADARPYEIGDDWRRIHWSLTARKNQPYLRLGQEERELTCLIAIDRSPSMFISEEKVSLTLTTAVAMGLSALLNGDRVRWVGFSHQVTYFSPAYRGEKGVWGALQHLWQAPPVGERSYLAPLLRWIAAAHKRRIFLVVISDLFFHDTAGWSLLQALAHRHFILIAAVRPAAESLVLRWGRLPIREVETQETFTLAGTALPPIPPQLSLRWAWIASEAALLPALRKALLPPLR